MLEYDAEAYKKLLEPKHVVHFKGLHPEYWQERVAGKYFRIELTQQIPYNRAWILAPEGTYEADISDDVVANHDLGLYPDNSMTLYEIVFGIKSTSGSVLLYPRFPPNEWFLTLEEGGFVPTIANNDLRYLGAFTEELSPPDKPAIRMHTIKEEESIGWYFYNDTDVYNKVVAVGVVNRCLMRHVDKTSLTAKELERCRELEHCGLMARGKWGEVVP